MHHNDLRPTPRLFLSVFAPFFVVDLVSPPILTVPCALRASPVFRHSVFSVVQDLLTAPAQEKKSLNRHASSRCSHPRVFPVRLTKNTSIKPRRVAVASGEKYPQVTIVTMVTTVTKVTKVTNKTKVTIVTIVRIVTTVTIITKVTIVTKKR